MDDTAQESMRTALEQALEEAIAALKSAPCPSEGTPQPERIDLSGEADDRRWKALLAEGLRTARRFELHCWREERDIIASALRYGERQASDWAYGEVIAGPVTPAVVSLLLEHPKPADIDLCNKMTPFFGIFLDNGFASSHYGTEVFLPPLPDEA